MEGDRTRKYARGYGPFMRLVHAREAGLGASPNDVAASGGLFSLIPPEQESFAGQQAIGNIHFEVYLEYDA